MEVLLQSAQMGIQMLVERHHHDVAGNPNNERYGTSVDDWEVQKERMEAQCNLLSDQWACSSRIQKDVKFIN